MSTYKIEETEYHKDSIITSYMGEAYKEIFKDILVIPPNITTYSIMVSFSTTDTSVSEEVQMNRLSDFISSVGGNLGLFIGFSFLSLLLKLSEFAQRVSTNNVFP